MSFTCHHLFVNPPPRARFAIYIAAASLPKTPAILSLPITTRRHFPTSNHNPVNPKISAAINFISEFTIPMPLCNQRCHQWCFQFGLFPVDCGVFVHCIVSGCFDGFHCELHGYELKEDVFCGNEELGLASAALALVMAVGIGAWIRRLQWRRMCKESVKVEMKVNLFERIEKLDEDLRSSATIIWVLSRQLEKLRIRFRVTRKALK